MGNPTKVERHVPVIVIGGGQAGLSTSHGLKSRGIDHLIFEKNRIAHSWRTQRWDNFCLVTPNWQCRLPGFPYSGNDPNGFMLKDEIVAYIDDYAKQIAPPVHEGVAVGAIGKQADGTFEVTTAAGVFTADNVVMAISGYHVPSIPRAAEKLSPGIAQVHSSAYRNAAQLPAGGVLVVGSGQSGCQIAEDLHREERQVHLAVGSAPRCPRVYRGRDAVDWLNDMGQYDLSVDDHPLKEGVRRKANHYLSGRDGGHEIDLRKLALDGLRLYGRLKDIDGHAFTFTPDLTKHLDGADAVYVGIRETIDRHIEANGIEAPVEKPYVPAWAPDVDPETLDLAAAGITGIIWCTGFRSDFSFVKIPAFDANGYPDHKRGVSPVEGLYFVGLPWLHTWGSGRFSGIGRDTEHVAGHIFGRLDAVAASRPKKGATAG